MPRHYTVQNGFTSGELDEVLHERYDHPLYKAGLRTAEGVLLRPQGAAMGRWGSRRVASAKNSTASRLIRFVFSDLDAMVLEFGSRYIRFYTQNGRVTDTLGNPIEVVTPYVTDDLKDLHFAQDGDVVVFTHPNHTPHELIRFSLTEWLFDSIKFVPPPTEERGHTPVGIRLDLSATSGSNVTITATLPVFLASDDDRQIRQLKQYGNGVLALTAITSATVATGNIIENFPDLTVNKDTWLFAGSPVALMDVDKAGPVGAAVTVSLFRRRSNNPELLTNGNFGSGLTGWTNLSGPTITTGTATSGSTTLLVNTAATFQTAGVHIGHRALNTTDTTEDTITEVTGERELHTSADGAVWAAGKAYTIRQTGTAFADAFGAHLEGGVQGLAWIQQTFTTVVGETYEVRFDVADQPVAAMMGSAAQLSDLKEELSYDIGTGRSFTFEATTTLSALAFRNNQNVIATVRNASVKKYNIAGWRIEDERKYVKVNDGVIELVEMVDESIMTGVIRKRLDNTNLAERGTWSLEESQWSNALGFPRTLCFFDERLWFAGNAEFPNRIWGSEIGIRNAFGAGTVDTDAVQLGLSANEVSPILYLVGERYLIAGTSREEFLIRGSTGNTITPTSFERGSSSKIGSNGLQPIRTQSSVLFVQRNGRRIREMTFTDVAEQRSNLDRSIRSEHVTAAGVRNIQHQQEPLPIVWVVTEDDKLASMSYLAEEVVFGWTRHPMPGKVLDVCVIPHPDGNRDQVWLLIDWGVSGQTASIEYLEDGEGFYGAAMTDSTLMATFTSDVTSVTGLNHLEGKAVDILVDGIAQARKTVVAGAVSFDTPGKAIEVGLPITLNLVPLKPLYNDTPLISLRISTVRTALSVIGMKDVTLNGKTVDFTRNVTAMNVSTPLFTGVKEVTTIGQFIDDNLTITRERPYPFLLRSIIRTLEIEEP